MGREDLVEADAGSNSVDDKADYEGRAVQGMI
jgi:hypothetical protein